MKCMKIKITKKRLILGGIIILLILGSGTFFYVKNNKNNSSLSKDTYINFISEIYDSIQGNYWQKIKDEDLSNLFKLGSEKLLNNKIELKEKNKLGVIMATEQAIKTMDENQKKEFIVQLANIVLVNLQPFGRSSLYGQKQTQDLKNTVQNINPENDLYASLGTDKNSSKEELDKAIQKKESELKSKNTEEAQQELKQAEYAYETLSDETKKQRYDQNQVEPTVFGKVIEPNILHLQIKKMSPTTLDELKNETDKFDTNLKLNTLILDLRDNIGGSMDLMPYLLGPFIGPDQYAYEFFHQEEKTPFKTKFGWLPGLVRYKNVVILANKNTQSSAEIMTATLKKYNVGIFVGEKTKGWGTIEKVFEIKNQISTDEKYGMFLVHSLTLGDDNQPIESNGVKPLINITDKDWKQQLFNYFHSNALNNAVEKIWNTAI